MSTEVLLNGVLDRWEIGLSDVVDDHADIENLAYARWERIHDITPFFVSNTKTPDGYTQPHSWIVLEIGLIGYNSAISSEPIDGSANVAYDESDDSYIMTYCKLFYFNKVKTEKSTEFVSAIIATAKREINDRITPITVIRALAYYTTDA